MNDIDNILLQSVQEIREDVKTILQILPTLQSIEKCEKNRKELKLDKKINIRYYITTSIAFAAIAVAVLTIIFK